MNLKKLLFGMSAMAFVTSCTNDEIRELTESQDKTHLIEFSIPAFTQEDGTTDQTRTILTNGGPYLTWGKSEFVGIRPYNSGGIQMPFKVNDTNQMYFYTASAITKLENSDWEMKNGVQYTATYPYVGTQTYGTNIEYDFTKCANVVNGFNTSVDISKYDVMYASAATYNDGIKFSMQRQYALFRIRIKDAPVKTWKNIKVSTVDGKATLKSKAKMEFWDASLSITSSNSSRVLYDGSGFSGSDKLAIYFPLFPCTTGKLKLTMTATDGSEYTAELPSITANKGFIYTWTINENSVNGHKFVDLGLPTGTLWAETNIGANEDYLLGSKYAWGSTTVWKSNDSYSLSASGNSYIRYNEKDGLKKLKTSDDAAYKNWGTSWITPTHAQHNELIDNCMWIYTRNFNNTGQAGWIVYKTDVQVYRKGMIDENHPEASNFSLSDPHIFLPGGLAYQEYINYWSSELYEESIDKARHLALGMETGPVRYANYNTSTYRYGGAYIRPVVRNKPTIITLVQTKK